MRLGKEISSGTSILSVASAVFESEPLQKKWTWAEPCSPWGHDVHLVYNNPIGEDPKPRSLVVVEDSTVFDDTIALFGSCSCLHVGGDGSQKNKSRADVFQNVD